jgi:toluene monooxygenase system protein D
MCRGLREPTMTGQPPEIYDRVGPVLQSGPVANAIIAAIKDLNQDVMVVDRGAYIRVLVPRYCVVTRSAIERHLGRSFRFPGELETVMSAFKGSLQLNQDDAAWRLAQAQTMR